MEKIKIHALSADLAVRCTQASARRNSDIEKKVDEAWDRENKRRGGILYNGSVFSIVSCGHDQITGSFEEYRYFVAQMAQPELYDDLNMSFLAVSGVITSADGVVLGRRGSQSFQDRGIWELVPSGGLEIQDKNEDGVIDFKNAILRELEEETGLKEDAITSIDVLCLLEDQESHLFDIGLAIKTTLSGDEIQSFCKRQTGGEYEEFKIIPVRDINSFVQSDGGKISRVSLALLKILENQ